MVAENDAAQARHAPPPSDTTRSVESEKSAGANGAPGSSERFFCEELEEDLGETIETSTADEQRATERAQMVQYVAENLVGRHETFDSPFGDRALCYADFTASGKSLKCVEDYIQRDVLPLYGNTHTTTSITGLQSTCFRHEARQIIAQAVNAKITGRGAEDSVLFTGQGSTSAVQKLVTALGLHVPLADPSQRPVVFVGPFEHHSNLLPWRESVAQVVVIPENDRGHVDIGVLTKKLRQYASRSLKIGAFSAASNLTGILTDVDAVTATLHQHGALAFWDYASCAPYVQIDMNPVVANEQLRPFVYKDAVYFSGHKFIGGPGSPGVLVVKKRLLGNAVPTTPGGGTVFFVTERDHRYLSNREEREEGGTPDIIGSIRLGLAFEIKQRIGTQHIMERERQHVARVRSSFASNDKLVLLGQQKDTEQLPVFSFLIRCGDRFLHYNFVCALLNDLFGIQTRGGCQCAGPYATRLMGMEKQHVLALESALIEKKEMLRPGFSRMSLPYFMEDEEVEYILEAIHFIADEGWKLLPQYKFNHKSGAWKHTSRFTRFPNRKWLSHFSMNLDGASKPEQMNPRRVADIKQHRLDNLAVARQLAKESGVKASGSVAASATQMLDDAYEALRWFIYPAEAAEALKKGTSPKLTAVITGPYQPQRYLEGTLKHQWEAPEEDETDTANVQQSTTQKSVCESGACCPVPVETSVSSTREVGGKYPLRSTGSSSISMTNGLSPVNGAASDAIATLSRAQEITAQMSEKTAAVKLFPTPGKKLMRWVGQGLMQWNMIEEGDRLLLGVSGGKDSLSLLHILLTVQKRAPVKFYLACATVDPQTASFDPSPMKAYMASLGVEYHYLSENIIERAACEMQGDSICAYCSRMKRGLLYSCCRKHKFNKLVLAQHLDDLAESFFMSAMHNGQLRTMKAKYWNDEKDVEILRPLAYVREHELKKFAYDSRLPVINENCPACFEEPKERHRVKKMLAQEESLNPDMYNSIRRAILPLMDDSVYEPLNAIRLRVEKSKQSRPKAPSNKTRKFAPEPVEAAVGGQDVSTAATDL